MSKTFFKKIKEGWHKTSRSGGGHKVFFELKNALKINRTFSNVRWKVWLNANFLVTFFFIFLKLQLFYQFQPEVEKLRFFLDFQYSENHSILLKTIFIHLYYFCSNWMLVSLF